MKKSDNGRTYFPERRSVNQELNYKHLYYFWVTAKEGGMSHAAARLGLSLIHI